jgi:glycerol-3-phosphate dehydrogenase
VELPAGRFARYLGLQGFEPRSAKLPHQVVQEVCQGRPCGVLSGPSFAQELHGTADCLDPRFL